MCLSMSNLNKTSMKQFITKIKIYKYLYKIFLSGSHSVSFGIDKPLMLTTIFLYTTRCKELYTTKTLWVVLVFGIIQRNLLPGRKYPIKLYFPTF